MIYLKPVLPDMAAQVEHFLNCAPLVWKDKNLPLLNHTINAFQPLAQRLEKNQIENLKNEAAAAIS
jgi:methionyl-tRNA synthetase